MELHRHTSEMVSRDIMTATLRMKKLQIMKDKIVGQLKHEKLANEIKKQQD
jgi:hypothetical protein